METLIFSGTTVAIPGDVRLVAAAIDTLTFTDTNAGTYSGVISGPGPVSVTGAAGQITFTGLNTYTGLTTISNATARLIGTTSYDSKLWRSYHNCWNFGV